MIFLHKILPLFVMPTFLFLIFITISAYKGFQKIIYFTILIFYVLSTSVFSNFIMKEVEGKYYYPNLNGVTKADAIVVLSGMMRINEFENNHILEWGDIDRFFKAIELYFSKKSNTIIFTGGKSPYNITKISEGDVLKQYAIKFGVKMNDILVTKEVLNTSEESIAVKNLIGIKKSIILVTSAFHMKRAKSIFEKKGFKVIPYKVDYKTPPNLSLNFIDFLPSSSGLRRTEIALRELLGRLYYSL